MMYRPSIPLEFASPEFISNRTLSSDPAASTTTRAFTCNSCFECRSRKFAPFTLPVFLSTVSSRTIAFGTICNFPVAIASGNNRFTELACPFRPFDARIFDTKYPRPCAISVIFFTVVESGP